MLEIINLSKDFKGVHALREANATFYKGEIHGLVGENGAGKSTMIKIIGGLYPATSGVIKLNGEEVNFRNPYDAYNAGIRIVHQELSLIRSLSIAENMFIHKFEHGRMLSTVDRKKLITDAQKTLNKWGINVNGNVSVSQISMGVRQLIEIARELSTGGKIIILDEPTSSLTISEINELFKILKKLKDEGILVIFISHRLEEVVQLVDRITVLRDGETIGSAPTKDMTPDEICRMMADTSIKNLYPKTPSTIHETMLETENLSGKGFQDISIEIHRGEIVGLAGLIGAGRSEICRGIFGLDPIHEGRVKIHGQEVQIKNPRIPLGFQIALLSENREEEGIFPGLSVAVNILALKFKNAIKHYVVQNKTMDYLANTMVKEMDIDSYDPMRQTIQQLSGGNQQKTLFARLLAMKPKILILDEPTRGVDVSNKTAIHKIMGNFVSNGGAILMVSSELNELFGICDRIYVLHEGNMVAEVARSKFNKEKVLRLMMGLSKEA